MVVLKVTCRIYFSRELGGGWVVQPPVTRKKCIVCRLVHLIANNVLVKLCFAGKM